MSRGHYVYILECSDQTYYTGYTISLARRLKLHQLGKASKYTRVRLPVNLVYSEKVEDRSAGLRREIEIKKLRRKQKEQLVKMGGQSEYSKEL